MKKRKPILYILRGLPGSGKTTIALKLVTADRYKDDDMFCVQNGRYVFSWEKIDTIRAKCFKAVKKMMLNRRIDCAVASGEYFGKLENVKTYIDLAHDLDFMPQVIEVHSEFENTHGVPVWVIKKMRSEYEPYITPVQKKSWIKKVLCSILTCFGLRKFFLIK